VDLQVAIGYGSDIQKAHDVITELMKQDARILLDPAAQVAVSELGDLGVKFVILPWVKTEDYLSVKFDLTRQIKEAFDKNNIEIGFPQRAVHIISGGQTN